MTIKTKILFFIVFYSLGYFAQNKSKFPNADPTKFISVYDQRKNNSDAKLISEFPSKKYINYVDESSTILIDFDIDKIATDKYFLGSLSLRATLNQRDIPVEGYINIGKKEKEVGMSDAFSAQSFASSLVGMLEEAAKYDSLKYEFKLPGEKGAELFPYLGSDFDAAMLTNILQLKKGDPKFNYRELVQDYLLSKHGFSISISDTIKNFETYYRDIIPAQLRPLRPYDQRPVAEVISAFTKMQDEYTKKKHENDISSLRNNKKELFNNCKFNEYSSKFNAQIPIFENYVTFFIVSNPYALSALSVALRKDPVFIKHIITGLNEEILRNKKIDERINRTERYISDNSVDNEMFRDTIVKIADQVKENITRVNTLIFDLKSINNYYVVDFYSDTVKKTEASGNLNLEKRQELIKNDIFSNNAFIDLLKQKIARESAMYAFSLLTTGIINLEKLEAKEGDLLTIYVEWSITRQITKMASGDDTIKTVKSIPITSVRVKKLGWSAKVSDSFFLINRFNPDPNDANTVPGRFLGAPGGSILLTYGSDRRKYIKYAKESPDADDNRLRPQEKCGISRFFRSLEASVGINVSYVNFDTQKDFEVASGIVIGLFRNTIMFTGGYNLNVRNHPFYFGLGFSFGQVYQNLKTGFKSP